MVEAIGWMDRSTHPVCKRRGVQPEMSTLTFQASGPAQPQPRTRWVRVCAADPERAARNGQSSPAGDLCVRRRTGARGGRMSVEAGHHPVGLKRRNGAACAASDSPQRPARQPERLHAGAPSFTPSPVNLRHHQRERRVPPEGDGRGDNHRPAAAAGSFAAGVR
jgi:hypothetical protein